MDKQRRSTKKQRELLNFVDSFIQGHGYGPSYREIMRALDYKSVSTVATHIDGLISGGYLRKRDNSARSLEVLTLHPNNVEVSSSVVKPEQEKWLVDEIQSRFDKINTRFDQEILDELYVLIGALKVLGLEGAYMSTKTKLIDYTKTIKKVDENNTKKS